VILDLKQNYGIAYKNFKRKKTWNLQCFHGNSLLALFTESHLAMAQSIIAYCERHGLRSFLMGRDVDCLCIRLRFRPRSMIQFRAAMALYLPLQCQLGSSSLCFVNCCLWSRLCCNHNYNANRILTYIWTILVTVSIDRFIKVNNYFNGFRFKP